MTGPASFDFRAEYIMNLKLLYPPLVTTGLIAV
jgi:hypothetical protein